MVSKCTAYSACYTLFYAIENSCIYLHKKLVLFVVMTIMNLTKRHNASNVNKKGYTMKVTKVIKGKYSVQSGKKVYEVVQNWDNTEWKLYEIVEGDQVWCDTFDTKKGAIAWIGTTSR